MDFLFWLEFNLYSVARFLSGNSFGQLLVFIIEVNYFRLFLLKSFIWAHIFLRFICWLYPHFPYNLPNRNLFQANTEQFYLFDLICLKSKYCRWGNLNLSLLNISQRAGIDHNLSWSLDAYVAQYHELILMAVMIFFDNCRKYFSLREIHLIAKFR